MVNEYSKDLTGMNTFGMKVSCARFIEYSSLSELMDIDFDDLPRPIKHLGGGSNVLFTKDWFKGTVLHSKIEFIEVLDDEFQPGGDDLLVSVGSGVVFDDFCAWAASKGLWGVENLSDIPGEVGASAVQNIGAYGVEVKDVIDRVYCYDREECELFPVPVEDCGYGYRTSVFKNEENRDLIVTHVVFRLSRKPRPRLDYGHLRAAVEAVAGNTDPTPGLIRKVVMDIRGSKLPDPKKIGSAGSFFKNPVVDREDYERVCKVMGAVPVPHYDLEDGKVKIPAAFLIEQCGWKGKRSGNAAVYEKQPLVLINATGMALPEEIITLENKIRVSVREKFGISLTPEVEHIN